MEKVHWQVSRSWISPMCSLDHAGFLIPETFHCLDEVRVCLECCKQTDLPVMVPMGMTGRTEDGASAAECAHVLAGEEADIVGLVCNGSPEKMLRLVVEMREVVDVPVSWQPNGYGPGGRHTRIPPEEMAGYAVQAAAVNLIGACCGSGPSHIRAMAEALGIN